MRIKLFEEFSEWDRDEFLFDLYAMSSTEVEELFFAEIKSKTPHIEKIEVMIKSGLVDVKAKDEWGMTPLHWASGNNHIEIAKLLIERGADLEAENKWGQTPLHVASRYNHIKMTKLFLDAGADLEAKNKRGQTPLHLASSMNSIEIAKLLIERGADVKAKDDDGETPLHWAQSDKMRALLGGGL
jgi:ankyrin repeat protein